MMLEKKHGLFLVVVGVWNLLIWGNFAKNLVKTAKDPEQSRPKPYYVAHAVLVVVDSVLGVLLGALGLRALRGRR